MLKCLFYCSITTRKSKWLGLYSLLRTGDGERKGSKHTYFITFNCCVFCGQEEKGFILSYPPCRNHFYQFGEIRTITVVQRQQCAFIQFATRQAAEVAAEKSFNKLIVNGRRLNVKWGRWVLGVTWRHIITFSVAVCMLSSGAWFSNRQNYVDLYLVYVILRAGLAVKLK